MPTQGRGPGLVPRLASLALTGLLAAADLATKSWAFARVPREGMELLPPVLDFRLSRNPGIFMGFGGQVPWLFTGTTLILLAVLLWVLWTKPLPWTWRLAVAAIASGALGNGVDRVLAPYSVRDFIDVHYGSFVWPTFNVADSCICVGAAVLALGLWKAPGKAPDAR